MRFVASGGGTAGHVYPALTVLQAFTAVMPEGSALPRLDVDDLMWIGSQGGIEENVVRQAGVEFVGLPAGGLRGAGPWSAVHNAARIAGSVGTARQILSAFAPDAVLVTGGYACVSVTLAARTQGVPVLVYLPDVVPGLAIRFLSRFAARVAVTTEESMRYLDRTKAVVTGYPVRPELFALDREQARRRLGLDPAEPTLLVFGGSRGARSINRALLAGLNELLPVCQVLHISGSLDAEWVASAASGLPGELSERYHPHAYLHDMPAALVAADLAVARAGAATLGEFPAAGLPAVLVPYPYSGQHQQPNADYLARRGAARVLQDGDLPEKLLPTVLELLGSVQALAEMRKAAVALARPDAAGAVAGQLCSIARRRPTQAGGRPTRRIERQR
jgi:UDP-N-acetylglucosamine--N-acetylmuramyl-(pentapeptide) pyrophosphoryl-undecaprenol N-acetylglucosamine transferase